MTEPIQKELFRDGLSFDRTHWQDDVERTLRRGGLGNPDVLLVRRAGGHVVVKDFSPRPRWLRETLGRWLTAREQRAYRQLEGLDLVPALLGRVDRHAFVMEYRPGRLLSRSLREELSPHFLAELERGVSEMHARGIVHLDLSHRSNILLGEDGRPVLLDFATAIRIAPRGRARRSLISLLAAFDRRALRKWKSKLGSGSGEGDSLTRAG